MRTSGLPTCKNTQPGFTLIEILVVVLIITILSGVAVARMPAIVGTNDLREEQRRLKLLFRMAHQEAIVDSREFGFRLTDDGYKFLFYDDAERRWSDASQPYHARVVDPQLRLSLNRTTEDLQLPGQNLPPVLILSSGETTAFELRLEARQETVTLAANGYGDFEWQDDE